MNKVIDIAKRESMQIEPNAIEQLIETSGNDIRQVINLMQMWKTTSAHMSYSEVSERSAALGKDSRVMISNFDAATRLMNGRELAKMQFRQKLDLFFIDYDLIPLLVHENYLDSMKGGAGGAAEVQRMALAAEFISFGDELNQAVRGKQEWALLQNVGVCGCIGPCTFASGFVPFPKFPE